MPLTKQVLRPDQLSRLAGLAPTPAPSQHGASATTAAAAAAAVSTPRQGRRPQAETSTPGGAAGAAGTAGGGKPVVDALAVPEGLANALRLTRYAMRRVAVLRQLLQRLATIPEAIEMGRAVGLTLGQVGDDKWAGDGW